MVDISLNNLLIAAAFLCVTFGAILLSYQLLGKIGLYACMLICLLYANIQVNILIEIFGVTTTLGNILYGASFLVTDVLSEKYGRKEAQRAVYAGLIVQLLPIAIIFLTFRYIPSPDDMAFGTFRDMFGMVPRITIAGLCAFFISQNLDVRLFHWIKERTQGKRLWLRNNG